MKKVILYTRVSTDEQADKGYSLKHQIDTLRKYCELKGYEVVNHFQDDFSAKTFNRPEWIKLEKYCRANKKNIDTILFTKWDRFSRNIEASLTTIRKFKEFGIVLNSIEQPLDLSNSDNKIMLSLYLTIPEVENDKISSRTREGSRRALKEGCFIYRAPFGYEATRINNNATLKPHETKAEIVKYIFEEFSKGIYTQKEIRSLVWDKFRVKLSRSNVNELLRKKVYIGLITVPEYGSESEYHTEGIHPAIVKKEVFYKVQDILDGKRNKPQTYSNINSKFPLRGRINCANCGKPLTASSSKGRKKYYDYYHCHTPCQTRFTVNEVHTALAEYLENISVDRDLVPVLESIFKNIFAKNQSGIAREISRLQSSNEELKNKINLAEERLFNGELPIDVYNNVKARFEATIIDNNNTIKSKKAQVKDSIKLVERGLMLLSNLKDTYINGSLKNKGIIIDSIFPNKIDYDGNKVSNRKPNDIYKLITKDKSNEGNKGGNKKAGQSFNEENIRLGTLGRNTQFIKLAKALSNPLKSKYN